MAMTRQPFNDFLNTPGPSTPRGRGRGRGGGGGGGGRGRGGGRGGGQTSGGAGSNLSKSDYSNVPFDYTSINTRGYNKMDGYVQPFGPTTDSPRGRGSQTPRGRGRGRGAFTTPNTASPGPDSGSATPVRGIGHKGRGSGLGFRGKEPRSGYKAKSTVGREGVMWGGRGAPLFVKGGELFKDGEVDIIKQDGNKITIETLPMSDPSAPQMTDLHHLKEVDVRDLEALAAAKTNSPEAIEPALTHASPVAPIPRDLYTGSVSAPLEETEDLPMDDPNPQEPFATRAPAQAEAPVDTVSALLAPERTTESIEVDEEVTFFFDTTPAPRPQSPVLEDDPFYVDIDPEELTVNPPKPMYRPDAATTIGQRRATSDSGEDEEIVFAPRKYKQPVPITLDMPRASSSSKASSSTRPAPRPETSTVLDRAFAKPKGMTRAQKKAAKNDKRKGVGKKLKRAKRQSELAVASDIEWGSDGPPSGPRGDGFEIDSISGSDDEDDIAVLQDYLAGTLLNEKSGQSEDDDSNNSDSVVEELDSDEVDEAIEIDMMKQFGDGVNQWNENGSIESESDEDDDNPKEEGDGSDSQGSEWEDDSEAGSSDDDIDDDVVAQQIEEDIDRQLALALEKDGEEDSEMEELFTGKAGWGDETDWFIQSMEDALDSKAMTFKHKQKKSQSKLFHAIENGDFGDLDLPTEPAKKNKNKHVPVELQAQWEKDRLAKAEKKRQRALDRLMAEMDPYPAARTKTGKVKGKGKGKGKSPAHAATLAHLIPASASEVADMFDISSAEEAELNGMARARRMGKGRGLLPDVTESWMVQLNEQIREFLDDNGKQTFSLPPMDGEGRKKIHMLAECYGLQSKSRGGGRARFTILFKNSRSGQMIDTHTIDRLVEASTLTSGQFHKQFYGNGRHKANKFDKSTRQNTGKPGPARQTMPSLRAKDGEQVGGGAERIGMDNIGHQLLSKMGWAEGDRIGRGGGLEIPIVAIVKNTKSGLGA